MLTRLENSAYTVASAILVVMAVMIFGNVVARFVWNSALPDTTVIIPELVVAAIMLPLAFGTRERQHISVDVFTNRLPGKVKASLFVFGTFIGLLALTPLLWFSIQDLIKVIERGSIFEGEFNLPKWPGRAFFVAGLGLCWVRLWAMLFGDIRRIRANKLDEILNEAVA
ncbi:hypothetical protein RUESEDTHA_04121 [Ruegeria sp. THAF57]|uniref:TRAP transporter small permease n=1 Tax=Ruegeria sp. THAF57 TaxID=2744555 RepID=UPI0015DD9EE2|nr:TRAP transporter small permease [Ruegeria sp. THAF57]CAD0187209.1 hypothetical protein RUESEDTHA_04121 [Ruegeria sp. THAF57]